MQSIFVITNDRVMKAIEYTKQIAKDVLHLFYATCTNDIVIYSKQASTMELFILAFLIECNRFFIIDSIAMNKFQKYYFRKRKIYVTIKKNIAEFRIESKNSEVETFFTCESLDGICHKDNLIN